MERQAEPNEGKPVLVIDGATFDDLRGLAAQFSTHLDGHEWTGNLDAFNDILGGGFGTPEGGFALRWLNSALSAERLGSDFWTVVEIVRSHGPGGGEPEHGVILDLA